MKNFLLINLSNVISKYGVKDNINLTCNRNCHSWIWPEDVEFVEEDDGLLAGPGDGEGKNWVYVSSFISNEKILQNVFIIFQLSLHISSVEISNMKLLIT